MRGSVSDIYISTQIEVMSFTGHAEIHCSGKGATAFKHCLKHDMQENSELLEH